MSLAMLPIRDSNLVFYFYNQSGLIDKFVTHNYAYDWCLGYDSYQIL